ncbi:hypothetical protein PHPALM_31652 [Phytophthora palmivora]|uniref:Uncharacterized protein n=1 Tax=Phytophthora palmivora TaxID=4796 RepID=A0A2P4X209_9STRA|nr:hypothetical protein PHPALM_31652 [Phytophthora palmivora]
MTLGFSDHHHNLTHYLISSYLKRPTVQCTMNSIVSFENTNPRPWTKGAMDGAAARGRLDLLKKLRYGRSVGCSSAAFIGAARNNFVPVLQWLSRYYIQHSKPSTELAAAAERGHMERQNGHVEVVQLLMENSRIQYHSVILQKAAEFGHIRVMELVLDQWRPREINIAIPTAGAGQSRTLRTFLEKLTFDERSIVFAIVDAARNDHNDILTLLLQRQSFVEAQSDTGDGKKSRVIQVAMNQVVSAAVLSGHISVVRMLIDKATNPIKALLQDAATKDRVEMMELLLNVAETRTITKHRLHEFLKDALNIAASRSCIDMAQLLVSRFKNIDTSHALKIAVTKNDTEMVNVLIEKNRTKFKINALFTAAKKGDVDRVKALLQVSDQLCFG